MNQPNTPEVEKLARKIVEEIVPDYVKEAVAKERERCVRLLEGDVLLTPDEFEGITKLKVFEMLERVAAKIRSGEAAE